MEYFTWYSLDAKGKDAFDVIDKLRSKYDDAYRALWEDGKRNQCARWYDHENDMKAFSLMNHDVLFTLNGVGEEYPDIWVKYFKNGKMQAVKARIELDPFDETKLK